MTEQVKNLGALAASSMTVFNVDDATFGLVSHHAVMEMSVLNSSQSNLTILLSTGATWIVRRGLPAEIVLPDGLAWFMVTCDATAVADGEVQVILKGNPRPLAYNYARG